MINAIYEDREEAGKWVEVENKKSGFELYYIEVTTNFVKKGQVKE